MHARAPKKYTSGNTSVYTYNFAPATKSEHEKKENDESLDVVKNRALIAAHDLRYSSECIDALSKAKSIEEVNRIMVTARHGDL